MILNRFDYIWVPEAPLGVLESEGYLRRLSSVSNHLINNQSHETSRTPSSLTYLPCRKIQFFQFRVKDQHLIIFISFGSRKYPKKN